MAPTAVAVPLVATDPGYLFWAPIGTAEPTHAVTSSVFSDAWPGAWLPLGATDAGSTFGYQIDTDKIEAAEFFDPIRYVTTGRTGTMEFGLVSIHTNNIKRALNGGTITTTGTGATTMSTYTPPAPGSEVRCMIGWESLDNTERLIAYQCLSSGQVQLQRQKGSARAVLPFTLNMEIPASGNPFKHISAGVARLGA
jgi:hypothetical protein